MNAIRPGFIATDITAGKLTPEMRAQALAGIPMGRAGESSDLGGCALFLASAPSTCCTGAEVDVNGGLLIHGAAAAAADKKIGRISGRTRR